MTLQALLSDLSDRIDGRTSLLQNVVLTSSLRRDECVQRLDAVMKKPAAPMMPDFLTKMKYQGRVGDDGFFLEQIDKGQDEADSSDFTNIWVAGRFDTVGPPTVVNIVIKPQPNTRVAILATRLFGMFLLVSAVPAVLLHQISWPDLLEVLLMCAGLLLWPRLLRLPRAQFDREAENAMIFLNRLLEAQAPPIE